MFSFLEVLAQVASHIDAFDMPHKNQFGFINQTLNLQQPESTPSGSSTSIFALNNATRQPRRRAESMPWSHQTSILKPFQNSFQLKTFPKTLPIPHFVQTEHREGFAGWFGARDSERTQSLSHHITFDISLCILMLLSQLTWIIFFSLSTTSAQDFSNEIYETYEEPNVSLNSSKEPKTLSSLFSQDPWNVLLSPAYSMIQTSPCPPVLLTAPYIPAGMTGIHWNSPEWHWNPQESTGMNRNLQE